MLLVLIIALLVFTVAPPQQPPREILQAREMIAQRRYDAALGKLEEALEARPQQPDALMFMGTVTLYRDKDFLKAKKYFEDSFQGGGGGALWVNHSHEKLGTDELADYCRGWLYLRRGEIEYVPEAGEHAFRLPLAEIKELEQNRLAKKLFHIKDANKTYNFRPRTGDESEVLLIVALYKKFSR
jgi:tetratricopeptide (TPR) repeat protein